MSNYKFWIFHFDLLSNISEYPSGNGNGELKLEEMKYRKIKIGRGNVQVGV